jgi:hypothetical protein
MKVLFNDRIQDSDAPAALKTPALSDNYAYSSPIDIEFPMPVTINALGIANTDANMVKLTFTIPEIWELNNGQAAGISAVYMADNGDAAMHDFSMAYIFVPPDDGTPDGGEVTEILQIKEGGLYLLHGITAIAVRIETDATYIGRLGLGRAVRLGTSIAKEPGMASTHEARRTLSGQIISGAGGYTYRTLSLDTRYKIGAEELSEILAAYPGQTGFGMPYFLLFDDEARRLPWTRMYAQDTSWDNPVWQGGINKFLFSKKFDFEECF